MDLAYPAAGTAGAPEAHRRTPVIIGGWRGPGWRVVDVGSGQAAEAAAGPGMRVPALRWRRAFPGDQAQISALRRWLEQLLPPCPARDDVVGVAVELCTNAVCYFLLSSCV